MNIPNYCRPCGETLLPEQRECPFCGQMATPVDELPEWRVSVLADWHDDDCEWHHEQVAQECTCWTRNAAA